MINLAFILLLPLLFLPGLIESISTTCSHTAAAEVGCPKGTRAVLGVCLGSTSTIGSNSNPCCGSSPSASTIGVGCSSVDYFRYDLFNETQVTDMTGGGDSVLTSTRWHCGTDGEQMKCSSGVVTGLCSGSDCASGTCNSATDVVAMQCSTNVSSLKFEANMSLCHWVNNDDWRLIQCRQFFEVAVGVCKSTDSKFCGGYQYGLYCCFMNGVISFTKSRSLTRMPTRSRSPTKSQTATSSKVTRTSLRSVSVSITLGKTVTPLPTRTPSRTKTAGPSQTKWPTRTRTPTDFPTHSRSISLTRIVKSNTHTRSLPSRTRVPTRSHTATLPSQFSIITNRAVTIEEIQNSNTSLMITSQHAQWRVYLLPQLSIYCIGAQFENPFGFNARKNAILDSFVPLSKFDVRINFRKDDCFEPRGNEVVNANLPDWMFDPPVALDFSFTITSINMASREKAGLGIVITTLILLTLACFQGASSLALHTLWSLQTIVLIAIHPCSRARIAAYAQSVTWIVRPTENASTFRSVPGFGIVFIHLIIVLLVLVVHLLVARKWYAPRAYFPNVPFFVAGVLLQGVSNAGWHAIVSSDEPVVARLFAFLFTLIYIGCLLGYVLRNRNPPGLKFERYPAGKLRMYFSGRWMPPVLSQKFISQIGSWNERSLHTIIFVLIFYSASSFLTAFYLKDTDRCFGLHGTLLAVNSFFFLYMLWMNPIRNILYNPIFFAPVLAKLLLVTGVMASLDCRSPFPTNVAYGEIVMVFALAVVLLAALALNVVAFMEGRILKRLKREEPAKEMATLTVPRVETDDQGPESGRRENEPSSPFDALKSPHTYGEQGPNPLPPLTHFELREAVEEDTHHVVDVQKASSLLNRDGGGGGLQPFPPTSEPYKTFETDVPASNPPSGYNSATGSRRGSITGATWVDDDTSGAASPRPKRGVVQPVPQGPTYIEPLQLNLSTLSNAATNNDLLQDGQHLLQQDPQMQGSHLSAPPLLTVPSAMSTTSTSANMLNRRNLLGTMNRGRCCRSCGRYLGFVGLCEDCSGDL